MVVRPRSRRRPTPVTGIDQVAAGYDTGALAWADGPGRVYDRLAAVIVDGLADPHGSSALDLGCGTGAATAALLRAGARVTALDVAAGMLAVAAAIRPSCVVGDATALPFRAGSFDLVVAAFSINHLTEPSRGLREARRVTRQGGVAVITAYATDDDHPIKAAVAQALLEFGWTASPWMEAVRRRAMPRLATVERAQDELARAGVIGRTEHMRIDVPGMTRRELIEWRLGMADAAPFVQGLGDFERADLRARSDELLGHDPPALTRSVIIVTIDA